MLLGGNLAENIVLEVYQIFAKHSYATQKALEKFRGLELLCSASHTALRCVSWPGAALSLWIWKPWSLKDPKQPPDIRNSKIAMFLFQRSWACFHVGTKQWAFRSFGYPHPQTQDRHIRVLKDSELFSIAEHHRRSLLRNIQGHILVCSMSHSALCQGSSLQPRNWAEQSRGVVTGSVNGSQKSELINQVQDPSRASVISIRRYGWGQDWGKAIVHIQEVHPGNTLPVTHIQGPPRWQDHTQDWRQG